MLLAGLNRKWWVLIGVSIASFMGCLDFTIVNTALPAIQQALNTSVSHLQWIITIFVLALSAFMVIMGRLADIYGRRKLLYIGVIVFGLASLGAGLSYNIATLIFFRLIQGIACAILYTASGAIVSNAFPESERGKAIGILFGVNGVGLAMGPVLGGFIVSLLSWRWVFLINVPVIAVCLCICFFNVQESKNHDQGNTIDWWGFGLLLIALPCLIFGITEAGNWKGSTLLSLILIGISIVAFWLFYRVENKATNPIIEFHLFANRIFISSIIATFSLALFYCVAFFLMPLYLHGLRNEPDYVVGLMLLPTTVTVAILSPIVGRFVDSYGPKLLLLIGFAFFILSAWLQTHIYAESSIIILLCAFLFMGIGWACILGPSTIASLSSVSERAGAVALGSAWTMHNIGGAVGLSCGVVIYHYFAKLSLLDHLNINIKSAWIDKVVSNPDHAIALLQQQTQLSTLEITKLFHQFFISGYHAAMWFLCVTSAVTLVAIVYGMRQR